MLPLNETSVRWILEPIPAPPLLGTLTLPWHLSGGRRTELTQGALGKLQKKNQRGSNPLWNLFCAFAEKLSFKTFGFEVGSLSNRKANSAIRSVGIQLAAVIYPAVRDVGEITSS